MKGTKDDKMFSVYKNYVVLFSLLERFSESDLKKMLLSDI